MMLGRGVDSEVLLSEASCSRRRRGQPSRDVPNHAPPEWLDLEAVPTGEVPTVLDVYDDADDLALGGRLPRLSRSLDIRAIHEAYELRAIIEPRAAGLAVDRLEESTARELRRLTFDRPTGADDASGNAHLAVVLGDVLERLDRLVEPAGCGTADHERDHADHCALVDAILSGTRAKADRLARAHISRSKERMIESLVRARSAAELRHVG
jgi:DNA-binding FadR family transcriptional regulator